MLALTACLLALSTAAVPPAPSRWLTDPAQLLSAEARTRLDTRLQAYEQQTGHQVLVYIATSTEGIPIEDWANEAFAAWGVGRAKLDDGAVLFIFTEDRAARIEVGYGLEERLTDAAASRIIREQLAPRMAAGEAELGITRSVEALLGVIGAEGVAPVTPVTPARLPRPAELALMVLAGVVLLYLGWRHPGLLLLILSMMGRGGGHGGGGRGGFGGGGGRSGGGGASGRW